MSCSFGQSARSIEIRCVVTPMTFHKVDARHCYGVAEAVWPFKLYCEKLFLNCEVSNDLCRLANEPSKRNLCVPFCWLKSKNWHVIFVGYIHIVQAVQKLCRVRKGGREGVQNDAEDAKVMQGINGSYIFLTKWSNSETKTVKCNMVQGLGCLWALWDLMLLSPFPACDWWIGKLVPSPVTFQTMRKLVQQLCRASSGITGVISS